MFRKISQRFDKVNSGCRAVFQPVLVSKWTRWEYIFPTFGRFCDYWIRPFDESSEETESRETRASRLGLFASLRL